MITSEKDMSAGTRRNRRCGTSTFLNPNDSLSKEPGKFQLLIHKYSESDMCHGIFCTSPRVPAAQSIVMAHFNRGSFHPSGEEASLNKKIETVRKAPLRIYALCSQIADTFDCFVY
jgi:hypothetical protein